HDHCECLCAPPPPPFRALPRSHPPSLHDALPISRSCCVLWQPLLYPSSERSCSNCCGCWVLGYCPPTSSRTRLKNWPGTSVGSRSEEHTSELQSREKLVCRLLLEKNNKRPMQMRR